MLGDNDVAGSFVEVRRSLLDGFVGFPLVWGWSCRFVVLASCLLLLFLSLLVDLVSSTISRVLGAFFVFELLSLEVVMVVA